MIYTIQEYALIDPQKPDAADATSTSSPVETATSTPAPKAKAKPVARPAAKPVARKTPGKTTAPAQPAAKGAPKVTPAAAPKVKPAAKKAAAPAQAKAAPKAEKVKAKLIRDSFTMPREDWDLIQYLKERALVFKRPTKKSELLRAGLQALVGLSDAKLQAALAKLIPLKAGRPKGSGK